MVSFLVLKVNYYELKFTGCESDRSKFKIVLQGCPFLAGHPVFGRFCGHCAKVSGVRYRLLRLILLKPETRMEIKIISF